MTQGEAWQLVVEYFKPRPDNGNGMALSNRDWHTHLEGTTPIRVEEDEDGMAWFIRAKDEYSSRWLGDRFALIAARFLVGVVNKPVKFVIFTMGLEVT